MLVTKFVATAIAPARAAVDPALAFPPYRLSGTVLGALMNHRSAWTELAAAIDGPPYDGPPRAPVLYVKPRNTLAGGGAEVAIPRGVPELEIRATVGMIIGRAARRLTAADAMSHVAGFLIVNDLCIPHDRFFRPAIRESARDGFCPLSAAVDARSSNFDPAIASIRVSVDGELRQTANGVDWVRTPSELLAAISEFMTLAPGDVVTLGAARPAPRARPGSTSVIEVAGLGRLSNAYVAETP